MIPLFVILTPLLIGLLLVIRPLSGSGLYLLPGAALPALFYSWFGDAESSVVIEWLLLQSHLGLRFGGPVFLFFTAGLWALAGWYAVAYMNDGLAVRRFCFFWLFALSGNLGLVLAGDVPTFYTCFALMTFSAYGLVVHTEKRAAWRAGRIYIIMAVAGEAMLLAALLLAVSEGSSYLLEDAAQAVALSPHRNLILGLGLAGFGVKAGIFPLHFWLPLAHPVAPTPASAVLSGAMIKAGLLGWMQLFPGGHGEFPVWSTGLISLGLLTAFYGVTCGLPQRNAKTVLAYSSISQMGIMLLVVGAGLATPEAWAATLVVLVVYALNHGFSKGALFLGIGLCTTWAGAGNRRRRWVLAGLTVPALAIAGAPMMGGAVAKYAVKEAAMQVPSLLAPWLLILLPLSAVATSLLLGRFLLLARRQLIGDGSAAKAPPHDGRLWAWLVSIAASLMAVHFSIPWFALELRTAKPTPEGVWENVWPILAGGTLLGILVVVRRNRRVVATIPPGDLLGVVSRGIGALRTSWSRLAHPERWRVNLVPPVERIIQGSALQSFLGKTEAVFQQRKVTSLVILLLLSLLWLLLIAP